MSIDFTLAGAVIITGLVVVFVALIGLSLIVWLIGKLFTSTGVGTPKKKPAEPAVPAPKAPAAPVAAPRQAAPAAVPAAPAMVIQPVVEEGIGDEIVAVISAAVAAMFGTGEGGASQPEGGFVLRSIRHARTHTAWAQAGMLQNTQPF